MPSPPPARPASCPPSRTVFYIFVREKGSQPFEASPSLEHVLHSFSSSSELRFVSYVSIHPSSSAVIVRSCRISWFLLSRARARSGEPGCLRSQDLTRLDFPRCSFWRRIRIFRSLKAYYLLSCEKVNMRVFRVLLTIR